MRETDDRYYVTCQLDTFAQIDKAGAEILTKTLNPFLGGVADNNFTQTVAFVSSVSHTSEVNPGGMQKLAVKLGNVEPEVRNDFAQVVGRVATKAAARPVHKPAMVAEQPGPRPQR